jgi:2-phospho-L-lactate guanylyltransferase
VRTLVLVPIKAFADAKGRLDGALDAEARAELARELAATVLAAAEGLPVAVVCDDDEVEAFALERGAATVRQVEPGLNAAVAEGAEWAAGLGFERVLVAHADIPRAADLARIALVGHDDAVVLVPDRHADGTNVLVVPTRSGFVFRYGPGSFAAHQHEAARLGMEVVVVHDEALAWDVDTADDLALGGRDHIQP